MVTLTTDLGHRDPYLAIVKAALLSAIPEVTIIDLSNDPRNSHLAAAAYILKNSLDYFPEDTIHLCAIRAGIDKSEANKAGHADHSRFLAARYNNQFVISADNGLFSLMDAQFGADVFQIYYSEDGHRHFFLKDIFVTVAKHICNNAPLSDIGVRTKDYYRALQFDSYVNGATLRGKGIYIDDFGNIVTNITRERFNEAAAGRKFLVTLPGARMSSISTTYDDVRYGSPLLLFNTFGHLEVAVNGKSAYNMLCPRDVGTGFDFNLIIEFHD